MPWTFEWAAHRHGLYSREAFLEVAARTGLKFPHGSGLSREAAEESDEAGKVHDELHRQHHDASNHQRAGSFEMSQSLPAAARNDVAQTSPAAHPRQPIFPVDVIAFWREAGPELWFAKDPTFDQRFRHRFLDVHEAAAGHALQCWMASPYGSLALILLLDQYPRNAFRGLPRMYATDAKARQLAATAIELGHDAQGPQDLRLFYYLPFAHSEHIGDQDRSVLLVHQLGEPHLTKARHHREIVRRFGRFPHRNTILSRESTPEELHFLANGGFAG